MKAVPLRRRGQRTEDVIDWEEGHYDTVILTYRGGMKETFYYDQENDETSYHLGDMDEKAWASYINKENTLEAIFSIWRRNPDDAFTINDIESLKPVSKD